MRRSTMEAAAMERLAVEWLRLLPQLLPAAAHPAASPGLIVALFQVLAMYIIQFFVYYSTQVNLSSLRSIQGVLSLWLSPRYWQQTECSFVMWSPSCERK